MQTCCVSFMASGNALGSCKSVRKTNYCVAGPILFPSHTFAARDLGTGLMIFTLVGHELLPRCLLAGAAGGAEGC